MSNGNGTNVFFLVVLTGALVAIVVSLFANDVFPRRKWGEPTFALPMFERQAPIEAASSAAPNAPAQAPPAGPPPSGAESPPSAAQAPGAPTQAN